jgi:hypothetical protein
MKQSVAELLQLVGGNGGASQPSAKHTIAASQKSASHPASKTFTPHSGNGNGNGNGHSHKAPRLTVASKRQSDIPLEDDFKNF